MRSRFEGLLIAISASFATIAILHFVGMPSFGRSQSARGEAVVSAPCVAAATTTEGKSDTANLSGPETVKDLGWCPVIREIEPPPGCAGLRMFAFLMSPYYTEQRVAVCPVDVPSDEGCLHLVLTKGKEIEPEVTKIHVFSKELRTKDVFVGIGHFVMTGPIDENDVYAQCLAETAKKK